MIKTGHNLKYLRRRTFYLFTLVSLVTFAVYLHGDLYILAQGDDNKTTLEYFSKTFKNNIFDPNRRPYVPPRERPRRKNAPAPVIETFRLSGVINYDEKSKAYFKGTSSSISGMKNKGEMVENLRIIKILVDHVVLGVSDKDQQNGNPIEYTLKVGQSLTRKDGGEWKPFEGNFKSSRPASLSRFKSSSNKTESEETDEDSSDEVSDDKKPSEEENDILKMLMERRKKIMGE